MKKVIVEIDGREVEYSTITACAKALGVSVATVRDGAAYGYRCKGMALRYADGTRRVRQKGRKAMATGSEADHVAGLVARWYTKEWKGEYVSSEALASLIKFLRDNLGSDPNGRTETP